MSKSPSRRFPVTVTQLPVTRCQICGRTVAYRPGSLSEVLTEHCRRAHPEALGLPSQYLRRLPALPRRYRRQRRLPPDDPCTSRAGERLRSPSVATLRKGPHIEAFVLASALPPDEAERDRADWGDLRVHLRRRRLCSARSSSTWMPHRRGMAAVRAGRRYCQGTRRQPDTRVWGAQAGSSAWARPGG